MQSHSAATILADQSYYDGLIDEKQAAVLLGYTVRALQNWRVRGGGPKFVKVSARSIRYRRSDLINWIEARTVSHTSEPLVA
jgi:predicted DNA-binding transcriptional regulator AlpA